MYRRNQKTTKRSLQQTSQIELTSPPTYPNLLRYQNISSLIITPLMTSISLIPLELVHSNRDRQEAMHALHPLGLHKKRRNVTFIISLYYFTYVFFYFIILISIPSLSNFIVQKKIRYFTQHLYHIIFQTLPIEIVTYQFPKATVCNTLMKRGSAFRNIG